MTDKVRNKTGKTDASKARDVEHQACPGNNSTQLGILEASIPSDLDYLDDFCEFCDGRRCAGGGIPCDPPHLTEYL